MEKTCSRCGKTKRLSEFHKEKRTKGGHRCYCKECVRIYNQTYYAANRERVRAAVAAWKKANPEQVAAAGKAWREANPERVAASNRAYHAANRDRLVARSRAYYAANREQFAAYSRAYHAANRDRVASGLLQRNYGISLADYDEMLEAQDNGCAICGKMPEENGQRLSVDHDHETGQVRGLLCRHCNSGLGYFMHGPERLRNAIAYLEQWAE